MNSLRILPCQDSDELARSRRRELDIPREFAAVLGRATVDAARCGFYVNPRGLRVDLGCTVRTACAAKVSIPPDSALPISTGVPFAETRVQITNETTLGAARRLLADGFRPLALNYANGVVPGGGFLAGARAQEEVLCRSSALFLTLVDDPMYDDHRRRPRPDSTDWVIYSPDVPVFRSDDGAALESPWLLSVITCAAPYAPDIGQPEAGNLMQQRIHRVLAVARAYQFGALVLGAWGCGAFANDPARTANDFRSALEGEFAGAFSDVVFAIADWSPDRRFLGPFCRVFASSE